MATTHAGTANRQTHTYSRKAAGVTVFAAILMLVGGTLQALQGLVAVVDDKFYVVTPDYVYQYDLTTWGWVHLVIGVVVALAGLGLFQAAMWARVVAVITAAVSIIANFMWMPHYPLWSLTIIAFDVFVIWAVTAHGEDVTSV